MNNEIVPFPLVVTGPGAKLKQVDFFSLRFESNKQDPGNIGYPNLYFWLFLSSSFLARVPSLHVSGVTFQVATRLVELFIEFQVKVMSL